MFFDKKVWDDFEKEIDKWEREDEIDDSFGVGILGMDRLKVAATIISTLINDEKAKKSIGEAEATKIVFDYIKILLKK